MTMHLRFQILITLLLATTCVAQIGVKKCECVAKCFPNLQTGTTTSGGELDIRIVNGNSSAPAPTTSPPAASCASGLVQCCSECGITYNITNGPKPGPGQGIYGNQPWQAVLTDNKNVYLGGGVLLDEKHILTAAHKVYQLRSTPTSILVRLGEWDGANNVEPYAPQNSTVSKIFIHDQYSDPAKNLLNDVAILRLTTPIKYGPAVNPAINTACLPTATSNFADNLRCSVSGWGKNAFNGTFQVIIKEVDVPIVNNTECQRRLRTTKLGNSFVLDNKSFICAGGEAGKDACVGDGGSPLLCKINDRYQVAGLVAWGIGCANGNVPGVYVRVQSFLDFIDKSMKAT